MKDRSMTGMVQRKWLLVLLVAVFIRGGFAIWQAPTLDFEREGNAIHGSEAYDTYAQNLVATGIYGREPGIPDATIPPLYSYLLAAVYGLFGRGFIQIALLHILLDVISILLLYDIGRRLFPYGDWVGAGAGLFFACYPYLVFQNLTVIDTPLWIMLLHALIWSFVVLRQRELLDRNTVLLAVGGGAVLGLATLVRPITPPLALLAALWFLFRLDFWQSVLRLLPVALVSAVFVSGWTIRNTVALDAFVPMTTTSGANLWQGNSEWTVPVFRAGYDVQWTAPEQDPGLSEREADAERFSLAVQYWQENPDRLFELFWVKFLVHWNVNITPRYNPQEGEQWELRDGELVVVPADASIVGVTEANTAYNDSLLDRVGRPVHLLYFGGLFLLALVGSLISWRLWRDVSLIWFVQFSMTVIYMLFHPSTRYRAPTDPLLFLFSAYALVMLARWWGGHRQKQGTAPAQATLAQESQSNSTRYSKGET